jgi:hypothetical protein
LIAPSIPWRAAATAHTLPQAALPTGHTTPGKRAFSQDRECRHHFARRLGQGSLGSSRQRTRNSPSGIVTSPGGLPFSDLSRNHRGWTEISYSGYRFPPEIIQQAILLYVRFTLSFRDVEDLLAERGI